MIAFYNGRRIASLRLERASSLTKPVALAGMSCRELVFARPSR